MSAAHQHSPIFQSLRSQRELDVTREISRQSNAATSVESGMEAIAYSLLRVPGVNQVNLQLSAGTTKTKNLEWRGRIWAGPHGTALAKVIANGRTLGDLRIRFGMTTLEVSSPVRFAQYAGQQIASMLLRLESLSHQQILSHRLAGLKDNLASRKAVHRAAGVLATKLAVSDHDALEELYRRAREAGERPAAIAESIFHGQSGR